MIFPRNEFEKTSCKDANIEKGLLVDMFDQIDKEKWNLHSILLVKNGAKIFDTYAKGYGPNTNEDIFSISKAFTSLAIGICFDQKRLQLSDPILPYFAKELENTHFVGYEKVTIEHLLTMSVGQDRDGIDDFKMGKNPYISFFSLPLEFEPGTHFMYNNLASYMLSAIVTRVTGMTVNDFLDINLYSKLNIEKPEWSEFFGNSLGCSGIKTNAVVLGKIGMLLLYNGMWREEQVISADYVKAATTSHVSTIDLDNPKRQYGYGYHFWITKNQDFQMAGKYGQRVIVNRQYETVFVIIGYEKRDPSCFFDDYVIPALGKGWSYDNYTLRTYLQRFTDHSGPILEVEIAEKG
ncbi:MAG: serine hydrolase [Candidatus Izemoplasmatales bacterium]|jgi:CubicO group peptidase (beta-lactamase class C family)